jgi:hypothetical protein
VFFLFHIKIPPGQFVAVGKQNKVEEKNLVHTLYLPELMALSGLGRHEHGGVHNGSGFKVVIRFAKLHFQVCGFSVIESDVHVKTR